MSENDNNYFDSVQAGSKRRHVCVRKQKDVFETRDL